MIGQVIFEKNKLALSKHLIIYKMYTKDFDSLTSKLKIATTLKLLPIYQ